jgi:hypothetical protein
MSTTATALAVCTALTAGTLPASMVEVRTATCEAIFVEADRQEVDSFLAVALGWHESRFDPGAVSRAGAVGPLQVMPGIWCPGGSVGGCDLVEAGVRALKAYVEKYRRPVKAVCHYNYGRRACPPKVVRWAEKVVATSARARALARPRRDRSILTGRGFEVVSGGEAGTESIDFDEARIRGGFGWL